MKKNYKTVYKENKVELKNTSIYWMSREDHWWCRSTKRWYKNRSNKYTLSSHRSFKDKDSFLQVWNEYPDAECYEWYFNKKGKRRMYDLELLPAEKINA